MNKGDIVNLMATQAGISIAQATKALAALTRGVTAALKRGDRVTLVGFGTYSTSKRKARTQRNSQARQRLRIPARRGVKYLRRSSRGRAAAVEAEALRALARVFSKL